MSSVVKLKPRAVDVASAAAKLGELHTQRRGLGAGMADLQGKITKARSAPQEVDSVRVEEAALDAKEQAAATLWAEAGAEGPPPPIDAEARARLAERFAAAKAKAVASAAAVKALDAKYNDLALQASVLVKPIAAAAVAVLVDRLEADTAEAKSLIGRLVPLMATLDGCRQAIVEEINRGGPHGAAHHRMQLIRLEQIPGTRDLLLGNPQPNITHRFTAELEAMKRGDDQ
jgi:hypothetical protein